MASADTQVTAATLSNRDVAQQGTAALGCRDSRFPDITKQSQGQSASSRALVLAHFIQKHVFAE